MFHILRCRQHVVDNWTTTPTRPFWRVYWNSSPGALIKYGRTEIYPDADALICVPPALSVEQILKEPFEHLWFHVDTPLLSDFDLKVYSFPVDENLKRRLLKLCSLFQEGKENSSEALILKELIIYWFISGLLMDAPVKTKEVSDLVNKAIKIMDERLQTGVSSAELASLLGVSSKTLTRQFNRYVDMAPHKFLNSLRLKKAAALLFSESITLDEISDSCGFCNRSHFTRSFKAAYNQTPAAFRREQTGYA